MKNSLANLPASEIATLMCICTSVNHFMLCYL